MIRTSKLSIVLLALVVLLIVALPVLAADTKGKIKTVDADKNEFVITGTDNQNWTFQLDKTAKVFLNDKEMKLGDLQAGDQATITYEKKDDKLIASEVRCTRK